MNLSVGTIWYPQNRHLSGNRQKGQKGAGAKEPESIIRYIFIAPVPLPRHHFKLKETDYTIKLVVRNKRTQIKIEPNIIIRGTVYPSNLKSLSQKVKVTFNQEVEMLVLSEADLYGGKICAALDRQHPRDLFDIYLMFQNGGITDQILKAFLVYLISHKRPMSELLNPNFKDIEADYANSFEGMALEELGLEELIKTRSKLVKEINEGLTKKDKDFLISVSKGAGDFDLIELQHVGNYPAVAWKSLNINKMDSRKKSAEIEKLKGILFG